MNKMKKTISTLMLAVTLATAVSVPTRNANAGIIIGAFVPGVISALVGLAITSAGFFWGIQDEEKLNWKAGVLFVLDEKMNNDTIKAALAQKYPQLDTVLADEISRLVVEQSSKTEKDSNGQKQVILSEESLAPVLNILTLTNPALGEQIKNDLTR